MAQRLLAIIVLMLATASAAVAQDGYSVSDLRVEATADTLSQAQEQAVRRGLRQALSQVVSGLSGTSVDLSGISDGRIAGLVTDIAANDQEATETSYSASLNVSFSPGGVDALIAGLAPAEPEPEPQPAPESQPPPEPEPAPAPESAPQTTEPAPQEPQPAPPAAAPQPRDQATASPVPSPPIPGRRPTPPASAPALESAPQAEATPPPAAPAPDPAAQPQQAAPQPQPQPQAQQQPPTPSQPAPPLGEPLLTNGPVLVLPIWRDQAGVRLWDTPNPWREAWLDYEGRGDRVPLVVPFGDFADVQDISVEQALAGDPAALDRIMQRLGTREVLIAEAQNTAAGLQIRLARGIPGRAAVSDTLIVRAGNVGREIQGVAQVAAWVQGQGEAPANGLASTGSVFGTTGGGLFGGGAAPVPTADPSTAVQLGETAPGSGLATSGQIASLPPGPQVLATVPIASPADWFSIQAILNDVAGAPSVQVGRISPSEVSVTVTYPGGAEALRAALAERGLTVESGPTGVVIRRSAF